MHAYIHRAKRGENRKSFENAVYAQNALRGKDFFKSGYYKIFECTDMLIMILVKEDYSLSQKNMANIKV